MNASFREKLQHAEKIIKERRFFVFSGDGGNFYKDAHKMMDTLFSSRMLFGSQEFYEEPVTTFYANHPHRNWLGGVIPASACYLIILLEYYMKTVKLLKINENKYVLAHTDAKLDDKLFLELL